MNIDEELRQLRADSVDVSSLNRVRSRVLDQVRSIEHERSVFQRAVIWLWRGFPWRNAILGCAAVLAMSLGLWHSRRSNVASIASPKPVVMEMRKQSLAVKVGHSRSRRHPRPKVPVAIAETTSPKEETDTVVQLMTDDPNIVIYWLLDTTGGH